MVTIIVPVYNCRQYIGRCIESVLAQNHSDFELILINDGSKDDSLELLREYEAKDNRIRVIDKKNEGVVRAREDGVSIARGEYLTFLDADDYFTEDALRLLVDAIEKEKADLVIAGYSLHWAESGIIKKICNPKSFECVRDAVNYCIGYGECFLPIKLFRTDLYKRVVRIPRDMVFMEDMVGVLQYITASGKVVGIEDSIYYYFKHGNSACSRRDEPYFHSIEKAMEFLISEHDSGKFDYKSNAVATFLIKNLYYLISAGRCEKESGSLGKITRSELFYCPPKNGLDSIKSKYRVCSLYGEDKNKAQKIIRRIGEREELIQNLKRFTKKILQRIK